MSVQERFIFDGEEYQVDAEALRAAEQVVIHLPDGRRVLVESWVETSPPTPHTFMVLSRGHGLLGRKHFTATSAA